MRRSRPSTTGLSWSSPAKPPGPNDQPRVCASGLALALRMLSSAMACRCASFRPYRRSYSSASWLNMYGHMNFASWPSCPIQAAAPRCLGASAPGTLRSCSTASTSTQSYRPASISAVALEHRDAARGAGRLVPGGRLAPQPGLDGGGHRAQLPLPGEQLPEGVPDVDRLHVLRLEAGAAQGALQRLADHVGDLQALACVVPREVALVAAGDPRARSAHAALPAFRSAQTTTNGVTHPGTKRPAQTAAGRTLYFPALPRPACIKPSPGRLRR